MTKPSEGDARLASLKGIYESEDVVLQDPGSGAEVTYEEGLPRFLLIEKSVYDGRHFTTAHDSARCAIEYHEGSEYPADWEVQGVWDLDTGAQVDLELIDAQVKFDQAREAVLEAALDVVRRTVLKYFPDARSFTTNGDWETIGDDDTAVRPNIESIKRSDGSDYDVADHSDEWTELETDLDRQEVLLLLGDIGGPDFLGEQEHDI